jgi:predicted dienelactone hydrolase
VLALGAFACGASDPGSRYTSDDFVAAGPHAVGTRPLELVDETRPTTGSADASALPERTLPTDVYYPAAAPGGLEAPAAVGPFPLLVFAHGFMGDKNNSAGLARLLASHGHVVAAIRFPRTHLGTAGGVVFEDVRYQPGDVRFVIDTFVTASATPGDPLNGVVDPEAVILLGHSLGAFTVMLAGLHPSERHAAVGGVILLAGSGCHLPTTTFDGPELPLLLLHGDRDAIIPLADGARPIFVAAPAPAWLVTLVDGTHTGFVDSMAELLSGLTHADSLGCDALTGELPAAPSADYTAWFSSLGGTPLTQDCAPACSDLSVLDRGMNTLRQVELTAVTVRAFVAAVRHGDADAREFLGERLAAENPDLTVELR